MAPAWYLVGANPISFVTVFLLARWRNVRLERARHNDRVPSEARGTRHAARNLTSEHILYARHGQSWLQNQRVGAIRRPLPANNSASASFQYDAPFGSVLVIATGLENRPCAVP